MTLTCSQAKIWVKTHYEEHEEGVVAKSVMYKHYDDHCREQGKTNMETSIFGRVVKSVFPDVTIRRLGGRDNLKYYYCGIRAKETSPYAIDNTTTTRPKRRLRKRELVVEKTEVNNCLRWLHANYVASTDSSVIKTDVYDTYCLYCKTRGAEPLSIQYFGMVITHAFPNVTKRKLGPRTNQQKYYFGMQDRPDPMPPELVPGELITNISDVVLKSRKSYRENPLEEEEEDDYSCISPASDGLSSDIVPAGLHSTTFSRMAPSPRFTEYNYGPCFTEPVDCTLQHLRLKDEAAEEEDLSIKDEPLDLHIARESCERRTPDRPPSIATTYGSGSPSPPVKDTVKSKKIYKPRFHFDYHDETWNSEQESKNEACDSFFPDSPHSQSDYILRTWICKHLEMCKQNHVNRDQVYDYYQKYCSFHHFSFLPMTYFDETILKLFRGVVTMIHPSRKTFYEGLRIRDTSDYYRRVEEIASNEETDSPWVEEASADQSMEMSPGEDVSEEFSLNLDEDEEDDTVGDRYAESPVYQCTNLDDLHSTPEVLRDGKYYLKKWLMESFESVPNSCVLKADAYRHYEAYARSINQNPFEMNVFGKIVRQAFPSVSIRRLGGRVKPQYHYCGISVKRSSPLYQYMSGKDPAQRSRKKEIATDNRSAEIVLHWLRQNYESGKDNLILKNEVFRCYTGYCTSLRENPVSLNYFGKLVKHCFPGVEVKKFGSRTESNWYYYGLVPRSDSYSYQRKFSSLSPSDESKDGLSMLPQSTVMTGMANSLDVGIQLQRPSTSPIPITLDRSSTHHLGTPTGNSFGSPSNLPNHHLQPSLRYSPYDPNATRLGSPIEGPQFLTSHSPVENTRRTLHVRSTYDHSNDMPTELVFIPEEPRISQGQLLYAPSSGEGASYTRDHLPLHKTHHLHLGGQVVPSQTPPGSCTVQDQVRGFMLNKHNRAVRPFGPQEDLEIYNEVGME